MVVQKGRGVLVGVGRVEVKVRMDRYNLSQETLFGVGAKDGPTSLFDSRKEPSPHSLEERESERVLFLCEGESSSECFPYLQKKQVAFLCQTNEVFGVLSAASKWFLQENVFVGLQTFLTDAPSKGMDVANVDALDLFVIEKIVVAPVFFEKKCTC